MRTIHGYGLFPLPQSRCQHFESAEHMMLRVGRYERLYILGVDLYSNTHFFSPVSRATLPHASSHSLCALAMLVLHALLPLLSIIACINLVSASRA